MIPENTARKKDGIRHHFLQVRNSLPLEIVIEKSSLIVERVKQSVEFRSADVVHCYVSMAQNNEVYTHRFIRQRIESGKTIVVPKMDPSGVLTHHKLLSLSQLKKNRWGVPEPEHTEEVANDDLQLIIVPMVAGDRHRNRLGYGKGYYDRFLQHSNAVKAGLLFDCQLYSQQLPVESFDVPLDILFTEKERIG